MLQCKQKEPKIRQQETMGFLDPNYPKSAPRVRPDDWVCPHKGLSSDIEWQSDKPEECLPYRILIRVFDENDIPGKQRGDKHETLRSDVDPPRGFARETEKWL